MSNLNELLKLDDDVQEETKDILGGGGYVKDSGVYLMKIVHAFFEKSAGGAQGVNLTMKHADEGNTEFNTTLYVTSGDKKGNKPYFVNKQGNKQPLPSYVTVDDMCKLATGKPMAESTMSEKSVEVYDFTEGKKVNKMVQILDALTGAVIQVGLDRVMVNKWKDGAPTAESTERNEISKVFSHPEGKTVNEINSKAAPEFIEKWKNKHDGVTLDKREVKDAPAGGSAHAASSSTASVESDSAGLFGDN